jgi:two-component system, response regulator RegA
MTVLVLDDDPSVRGALCRLLELSRMQPIAAATMAEAAAALAETTLDAAVLDFLLPDGRGTELIPGILAKAPNARVVVFSAYPSYHACLEALDLGASDYLAKPIDGPGLVPLLRGEQRVAIATTPLAEMKHRTIEATLAEADGNLSRAARWLGVDRKTLARRLERRRAGRAR